MTTFASALPAHPGWVENLQFQLTGFLVVIFALGAIAVLIWVAGKIFALAASRQSAPMPQTMESSDGKIPGPVLAAISAAVSATLEGRHFVVYDVAPSGRTMWSAEGRRAIYRSHQLR